jgi:hypothetical protein
VEKSWLATLARLWTSGGYYAKRVTSTLGEWIGCNAVLLRVSGFAMGLRNPRMIHLF